MFNYICVCMSPDIALVIASDTVVARARCVRGSMEEGMSMLLMLLLLLLLLLLKEGPSMRVGRRVWGSGWVGAF